MADVKFREIMRPSAYLLPPKQRTIARFMNLSGIIKWACKLLDSFSGLTLQEQDTFRFLLRHIPIITELKTLFNSIKTLSKLLKNKGISNKSIESCFQTMQPLLFSDQPRVVAVAEQCMAYCRCEQDKLIRTDSVWHISSDIIESLFGNHTIH